MLMRQTTHWYNVIQARKPIQTDRSWKREDIPTTPSNISRAQLWFGDFQVPMCI